MTAPVGEGGGADMAESGDPMPMFPLGSVLFPHAYLPLRIFEPRYRTMVDDLLAGSGEFGVVLIERGSEVGGGDVRHRVATVARVIQAVPQPDGGWLIGVVGVRRVRVEQWLPDLPYPRAIVTDWTDGPPAAAAEIDAVLSVLRRALAMRAELDEPGAPATVELEEAPDIRLWQMCAVAPVGPVDDLALLRSPTAVSRLDTLRELLDDESTVLAHRLSGG